MARPLLEIPSLPSDSPITHALPLPPSCTGTGVRDGGGGGTFPPLAAPKFCCLLSGLGVQEVELPLLSIIFHLPVVVSSEGSRARGCPALVLGDSWWFACSLWQGLCCCCSLFFQETHQSHLAACRQEDEQPPGFFLFLLAFHLGTQLDAPAPPTPALPSFSSAFIYRWQRKPGLGTEVSHQLLKWGLSGTGWQRRVGPGWLLGNSHTREAGTQVGEECVCHACATECLSGTSTGVSGFAPGPRAGLLEESLELWDCRGPPRWLCVL